MAYTEPIHEMAVRTTATSQAEGRLKSSIRKKKRKVIKKALKRTVKY